MLLIMVYGVSTGIISGRIKEKEREVLSSMKQVQTQIAAVNEDKEKLDEKTAENELLIENLLNLSEKSAEMKRLKYAMPNLLNKIMYVIPVNVQLTSIHHSGTKIKIIAQSDKYEGLGIFIAKLSQDGILTNVKSDTSQKDNKLVIVTIEGELP